MRFLIVALAFLSYSVLAKAQTPEAAPGTPAVVRAESAPQYFPIGVFDLSPQTISNKELWYASVLSAGEEPSLLEIASNSEIITYRLLLVFTTRALSARLALKPDGTGILIGKLVVLHSNKPSIIAKDPIPISSEQVKQFLSLLEKADFWNLKTENKGTRYSMDGAQWVLEGAKNHTYHVVDRNSPNETDYVNACVYLMSLSPVMPDQDDRVKKDR